MADRVLLADHDREELAEYRSVSRLSIAALFLGLASLVALAHPVAWVVPAAGCLVGFFALRVTSNPASPVDGRQAALWGFCLSLFLGTAAVGHWAFERQILIHQARDFADRFLQMVQAGDYPRAVECTRSFAYRQRDDMPLDEYYTQNEESRRELAQFCADDAAAAIIAAGPRANLRFARVAKLERLNYARRFWLQYALTSPDQPEHELTLCVVRDTNPESYLDPHWHVARFQLDGAALQP